MWDRFLPNTPTFDPILAGMAGLLLLNFLWVLVLSFRFRALGRRYRTLFRTMAETDLEGFLRDYLETAREAHDRSVRAAELAETLAEAQKNGYRRSGVVRYNAFNDTSGHISFSLALMDEYQNGFVLTGMQGRGGCSIYAKALREGASDIPLTDEEREAIRQALSPAPITEPTKGSRSR
ncbi:MAG: DUF4446 family protein [Armatimonadetes bacterium]|nr:DUF4446 family protein [Armatimonadota bacterium]